MRKSWRRWIAIASVALVGVSLAVFVFKPRPLQESNEALATEVSENNQEPQETSEKRIVVGGIERPASDVRVVEQKTPDSKRTHRTRKQGFSPSVSPDANEQVESLFAALEDRSQPSRFSSFAPPEPFDREAYEANPDKYLATIEPSRVYAPAQPGPDVPVIRSSGSRFHRLSQGESVRLQVVASAGAPVTFHSSRLGQFENQLTSITVKANEEGVAQATFTASGGTIDEVPVLAASSLTSGQVSFTLLVSVPQF